MVLSNFCQKNQRPNKGDSVHLENIYIYTLIPVIVCSLLFIKGRFSFQNDAATDKLVSIKLPLASERYEVISSRSVFLIE